MKILTVIGARPQFIKAAVISREIKEFHNTTNEILVHTGQHYDHNMSEVFFNELNIPYPNYNLNIGGGTHGQNTGRMIEKLESIMIQEKPDWVLVYGDTDSTLAGAIAASKLHIPIAHVEAGLRSFNRNMPEEINRILTDHTSTLLLAPTKTSYENLQKEGISTEKIHVVGDVMYDAALFYKKKMKYPKWFDKYKIKPGTYILCTIHRAENTSSKDNMCNIFSGLETAGLPVILPLHPRTKKTLENMEISIPSNVYLIEPVSYLEMVWLEVNCKAIATDSGGVQKEAYFHNKKCITLRKETEWVELVESNWNVLVNVDPQKIKTEILANSYPTQHHEFYGNGKTAAKILELLK